MLDANMKQQLAAYLQNISQPVQLTLNLDQSVKAEELKRLAEEIESLSDKVTLSYLDSDEVRKPSMQVGAAGDDARITFAGVPMGHEFTSLVLALLHSGGHPIKVDEPVQQQIRSLQGEFNFEIYISLSCQNCPEVVQALNMMATLNPGVKVTMIDGALFPQEIYDREIMSVPSVYLNGELFAQGRISLSEILRKVDSGAAEREAAELSEKDPYDLLVVGGGPAGAAAAIYAARKGIRTGVVAERFGGQVADTMAIENFISVKATDGPKMVASLEQHVLDYDVDVMTQQRAAQLISAPQAGGYTAVELANGAVLKGRTVLLATGARWREMNVPGEQEYRGRGVAYCPHCDGPLFKGKSVAVIGGGNSGIEAAIDLAGIVKDVTVLEFDSKLRADEVLQQKARSMSNIRILTQAQTTEVIGDGGKVTGLNYTDRSNGETHMLELAGIFVQIGLVPNTDWLKDSGVTLSKHGEIEVDRRGQTSVDGVFAAGDVTDVPYKQIIIAMGSGASASLGAFDYLIRTPEPVENAA